MTIQEMQESIQKLKKEKDICILAHAYQSQDIWEVADYIGDSYGLSVQASKTDSKTIIMCGVRFMAETVKTLSPDKTVYLANPIAGCPMAAQLSKNDVIKLKEENPGYAAVCYINTTSEFKTVCDVTVTSSSAVKIIKNMPQKDILFVPDCNLGGWVKKEVPEKNFKFFNGGCPTHRKMTQWDVKAAKAAHPDALLLVHPECRAEVAEAADYVGSTTGIMIFAEDSDAKEFIIGTEASIVQHLQFKLPDKKFYPLSQELVCPNMRATTLADVYNCVKGTGGEEIILPDDVIAGARKCIDKMIELG